MSRWGEQTTNPLQRRDSQQSDARLRSVNQRVLRSDDSFFEYNDGTLIPVGGRSIVTALVAQSTDYALLDNDGDYIEADPTSADVTITLPTAADNEGRTITVRHVGSANSVILDGEGSEQVHGAATFELPDNGSVVVLRCDGTSWVWVSGHILGSNSNGEYVVFSSGLQVCWHEGLATYVLATVIANAWTFPRAFGTIAGLRAFCVASQTTTLPPTARVGLPYHRNGSLTVTGTELGFLSDSVYSSGQEGTVDMFAVGYAS